MSIATQSMTVAEYLSRERAGTERHEFRDGEMIEMVGGSEVHVLIICNLVAAFHSLLRTRENRVYASDMRTGIPESDFYTYPDVIVSDGAPKLEDDRQDTLLNPIILIEVLSPSTEAYDRGRKFELYRRIESLQEYVLVSQDRQHIECFRRDGENWYLADASSEIETVQFPAIDCEISVADIYAKVKLIAPDMPPGKP